MATSKIHKIKEYIYTEETFTWNASNGYFVCTPSAPQNKNLWLATFAPFGLNDNTWKLRNGITVLVSGSNWIIYPPSGTTFTAGTTISTYVLWF